MRVYRIVLMPPGHPIILLKSNKFNMAAVSVKRFIDDFTHDHFILISCPSLVKDKKNDSLMILTKITWQESVHGRGTLKNYR